MISNQILQRTIDGLAQITGKEFCVFDLDGNVLAATMDDPKGYSGIAAKLATSGSEKRKTGGCCYYKVFDSDGLRYIAMVEGDDDTASMAGGFLCQEIQELSIAYRDRFDRESFIKNLLLDNMLLVDIYNRAKKLGVPLSARRVIFLAEVPSDKGNEALHAVKTAFFEKMDDYAVAVEENEVILVHTLEDDETPNDMLGIAEMIKDLMNTEVMVKARVSCGTVVGELREISKSYKEARMALDVGKIFYSDQYVHMYDTLGIGRLIYQLPANLCKLFIDEIYGENMPKELDEEIMHTAEVFLENNLNVSETARQLYIHRNTLVYRIEKLKATTGLDVRVFDDALTFKIATMVSSYIKYMDRSQL